MSDWVTLGHSSWTAESWGALRRLADPRNYRSRKSLSESERQKLQAVIKGTLCGRDIIVLPTESLQKGQPKPLEVNNSAHS